MLCIVRRDCLGIFRQRRSLFLLGSGLLVLGSVFVLCWANMQHGPSVSRPPDMGLNIFIPIAFLQLLLLLSLSGTASQAICSERERDTWDLLIATPLGPSKILLGKLVSCLLFILLVYAAFLPIHALCFLLGGLSPRDLIGAYAILGGAAFLVATIGLFCSSYARRSVSAVRMSAVLIVVYCLLLPHARLLLLLWFLGPKVVSDEAPVEILVSPVYSLAMLLVPTPQTGMPTWMKANPHVFFLLSTALICLALLVLTSHRIGRLQTVVSAIPQSKRRRRHVQDREIRQRGMRCGWSAVRAKEKIMRGARRFARPTIIRLALPIGGGFLGLFLCAIEVPGGLAEVFSISSMMTLIMICLLSSAAPAAAIARERDRNTWDLLRVSALRSKSLVFGKAFAAAEYLLISGLCFFLGLYATLQFGRKLHGLPLISLDHLTHLLMFALLVVSCVSLYAAAGTYFSAGAKSFTAAHSRTFACIVLHALGGFILLALSMMLYTLLRPAAPWTWRWLEQSVMPCFLCLTPFGLLLYSAPYWGPRAAGWSVLVLVHSSALLVFSGLLIRGASQRIDRPDT